MDSKASALMADSCTWSWLFWYVCIHFQSISRAPRLEIVNCGRICRAASCGTSNGTTCYVDTWEDRPGNRWVLELLWRHAIAVIRSLFGKGEPENYHYTRGNSTWSWYDSFLIPETNGYTFVTNIWYAGSSVQAEQTDTNVISYSSPTFPVENSLGSLLKVKSKNELDPRQKHCTFYASSKGTELYEALKVIICFLFPRRKKRCTKCSVIYRSIHNVSRTTIFCKAFLEVLRRGYSSMLIRLSLGLMLRGQK